MSSSESAYPDIQGNLYGASERYITELDWADVAAKFEADEELGKVRNIYYLARKLRAEIRDKDVKQKQPGRWDEYAQKPQAG